MTPLAKVDERARPRFCQGEAFLVEAASTAFHVHERANRKTHGPIGKPTHHLRHHDTHHYYPLRRCAVGLETHLLLVGREHTFRRAIGNLYAVAQDFRLNEFYEDCLEGLNVPVK